MATMNRRTFLKMTAAGAGSVGLRPTRTVEAGPSVLPIQGNAANPEVVVIGGGAFGGWSALYLREMGRRVALVDAYGPGNSRSSSGGATRQIRPGYGDREMYSRWAIEALARWKAREIEWRRRLLFDTGQVTFSPSWTRNLEATKNVLDRLGVENEVIQRDDLVRRYPQFNLDGVELGFSVPSTGVLKAREGCLAVADAFHAKGGQIIRARAQPGARSGGRLEAVTLSTGQSLAAQSFVFACGPWHPKIFPEVFANKLEINRRVVFFFGTPADDGRLAFPNCPTFTTRGTYGFPDVDGGGLKVAPYWSFGSLDPDDDDRVATPAEIERAREFVETEFPLLRGQPLVETRVCPRTNSVDSHFIIDRHPELDNVWLVGGGSGHGFKHGPMVGEYVARRVTGQDTDSELDATFRLKDATFCLRCHDVRRGSPDAHGLPTFARDWPVALPAGRATPGPAIPGGTTRGRRVVVDAACAGDRSAAAAHRPGPHRRGRRGRRTGR